MVVRGLSPSDHFWKKWSLGDSPRTTTSLEGVKRLRDEFDTEHMKVHMLKIETAAMVTPYVDTDARGATAFNAKRVDTDVHRMIAEGFDTNISHEIFE